MKKAMVALLVFNNSHFRYSFWPKKTAGRKTFIRFGHNVIKYVILWFTVIGHFRVSWASVSKRG